MKETGVVRRIDELGRIVIPKEIRRHLRISCGDQIDIFTNDKKIILAKYQPLDEVINPLEIFINSVLKESKMKIAVADSTKIIVSKISNYPVDLELNESFVSLIKKNDSYDMNTNMNLEISHGIKNEKNCYIKRILVDGDYLGFVIIENDLYITKNDKEMANIVADFVGNATRREV